MTLKINNLFNKRLYLRKSLETLVFVHLGQMHILWKKVGQVGGQLLS